MKLLHGLVLAVLYSQCVFAQSTLHANGTTSYQLTPSNKQSYSAPKVIRLLNIKLTTNDWKKLNEHTNVSPSRFSSFTHHPGLAKHVQLGMNQVPVLDQGPYGTCVTFATTAAIDAIMNRGDYISQLCQLELGQYFEQNSYGKVPSGWDGSTGSYVLNQMMSFGFMTKDQEEAGLCGGMTAYPTDGNIPEAEMLLSDFTRVSTDMSEVSVNVGWSSLLDPFEALIDETNRDKVLDDVKSALSHGDRLTFGVLLFEPQMGFVGALGHHHVPNDTWVVTPQIRAAINAHGDHGGHEMVITGYDDDAVAMDGRGRIYKGLLTLRNSWGSSIGDEGDFYMSYEYFKLLALEVHRIRQL